MSLVGVPNPLASDAGNLSILESGQLQRQWWCFWWTVSTCIWIEYQWILQFFNQRVLLFNLIHFKICNVGLIPDSPGYGLNLTKGTSFWLKHLEKKTFDQINFGEERTFSAITFSAFHFSFSNTFIQVCFHTHTHIHTIHWNNTCHVWTVRCPKNSILLFSFILSSVRYFHASICSSIVLIGFKLILCQSSSISRKKKFFTTFTV